MSMIDSRRRIFKETKSLREGPPPGITAISSDTNIRYFDVTIEGPQSSPYEGGIFRLELFLPEQYPMEAPKVRFLTKIYHPNIDYLGRICLDILKTLWTPCQSIETVLLSIQALLSIPNPDDPLNNEVASKWKKNASDAEEIEFMSLSNDISKFQLNSQRWVTIILDCSESMQEPDLFPNRLYRVVHLLISFLHFFFEINPLSQIQILTTSNNEARQLSVLGGNLDSHIENLKSLLDRNNLSNETDNVGNLIDFENLNYELELPDTDIKKQSTDLKSEGDTINLYPNESKININLDLPNSNKNYATENYNNNVNINYGNNSDNNPKDYKKTLIDPASGSLSHKDSYVFKGFVSLQLSLLLAVKKLRYLPLCGTKQILFILSSLQTRDPGNIFNTIRLAKREVISVSFLHLVAEMNICQRISKETNGFFNVPVNENHLVLLLKKFASIRYYEMFKTSLAQNKILKDIGETNLIHMGFPTFTLISNLKDISPFTSHNHTNGKSNLNTMLNSNNNSIFYKNNTNKTDISNRKISYGHYSCYCPQCETRLEDNFALPSSCPVCHLLLIKASYFVKAQQYFLPQTKFEPIFSSEKLLKSLKEKDSKNSDINNNNNNNNNNKENNNNNNIGITNFNPNIDEHNSHNLENLTIHCLSCNDLLYSKDINFENQNPVSKFKDPFEPLESLLENFENHDHFKKFYPEQQRIPKANIYECRNCLNFFCTNCWEFQQDSLYECFGCIENINT